MKKLISIIVMAIFLASNINVNAQTSAELAKSQKELQDILRKSLNSKPTKEAKKQAKEFKKEGWTVPAGERSIEQQLTESQLLGAEYTIDANGITTRRFLQHTGIATAGSYNAAYAAARSNAQVELAMMLETELAAAMQGKIDNAQTSISDATTVDKFNQRMKQIVHESLSNGLPVMVIYRRLPNKNIEVQARIAYDKQIISAKIKAALQKELELEGDQLLENMIDNTINNAI